MVAPTARPEEGVVLAPGDPRELALGRWQGRQRVAYLLLHNDRMKEQDNVLQELKEGYGKKDIKLNNFHNLVPP